jgi:hypothetical protein
MLRLPLGLATKAERSYDQVVALVTQGNSRRMAGRFDVQQHDPTSPTGD